MDNKLLTGRLVRLSAQDPENAAAIAAWDRDTEYTRLLAVDPVTLGTPKSWRTRMERPPQDHFFPFAIRTLADDKLIGFIILMRIKPVHGEGWVGIGIGEQAYRGRGYGTDAMQLVLRFAFQEMNLHRVSLDAVATNARAVRSYQKAGFVLEGQTRGTDFRNGIRDNLVTMGILKTEWERQTT